MRSAIFDQVHQEQQTTQRWTLQSHKMLRVVLGPEVLAAQGAMVDILNTAAHQMAVTVDLYRGVEEEAEQVFRDLGDQI